MTTALRVREHGPHVVVVTIDNQPRRNAMTRAMMAELGRLWESLERGPCRCVVLTGAGDRAFTSGADMSGDLSADPSIARTVNDALLKTRPYAKPIVAAVNGDCVAGGLELLLTAKLIDAAEAARIGLVNRVLPAADLMPWALATAETIAANSPSAVQAVKEQISTTIAVHAQSREALDQELGDRVRASPHFSEGVRAFLEKRDPNYT